MPSLDDRERRLVRETREDLLAAPTPPHRAHFGCPVAILGLLLLLGWPQIADAVPGGGFISPFVLLAGALMLIGGPALALFGGGGTHRAAEAAVEAALRRLEDPETDGETAVRAATLLIVHAFSTRGPTMTETFRPDEVAERIGARMLLVIAVEEELLASDSVYPVFTLEAGDA